MARARNIKPGFFKNEDLGTADPYVSLLFAGLWTLADKAGILEDRPLRIRAELFPYRENFDINGYLTVLVSFGLIHRYEVAGTKYVEIINFKKHQTPHHTEKPSEYPSYSDSCKITVTTPVINGAAPSDSLIPDSLIPDSLIPDSLIPIEPSATPTGSANVFVPPDWIPQETWKAYCKTRSAKKAKNEPHALGLIVADLEKFKALGHDPVEVLNNSIKSGWAGVFEPKQQARASPGYQNIHDQRAEVTAILTGRKSNERTRNEHDITGESCRVA